MITIKIMNFVMPQADLPQAENSYTSSTYIMTLIQTADHRYQTLDSARENGLRLSKQWPKSGKAKQK